MTNPTTIKIQDAARREFVVLDNQNGDGSWTACCFVDASTAARSRAFRSERGARRFAAQWMARMAVSL